MNIRAKVTLDYFDGKSAIIHKHLSLVIEYKFDEENTKGFFRKKPVVFKIVHEAYAKNNYIGQAGKIQYYKDCIALASNKERTVEMAKEQILLALKKDSKKDKIEKLKKELDSLIAPKTEFEFEFEIEEETL